MIRRIGNGDLLLFFSHDTSRIRGRRWGRTTEAEKEGRGADD